MATLSELRTETLDLLRESATNSHFTTAQLNGFINHAQDFLAALSAPSEDLNIEAVVQDQGLYTLPTNQLVIQQAFFGTRTTANDIRPLTVIKRATARHIFPSWLDSTSDSSGNPTHLWKYDETQYYIHPRPNADNAGKSIFIFFGVNPTALSGDSDVSELHLQYHNIMPFFAARMAYLALSNPDMARTMYNNFLGDYKLIKDNVDKDAEETFRFQWGFGEEDNRIRVFRRS